jgi:hypothetical protein
MLKKILKWSNNTPYIVGEKVVMECHHGPDRNKCHKQKQLQHQRSQVSSVNISKINDWIPHDATCFSEVGYPERFVYK